MKTVEELLGEIRELSRGRVGTDQIDPLIDEVRAHLDASVQSRMQLGLQHAEAEQEAVIAFGDPREFLSGLVTERKGYSNARFDTGVFASILLSIVWWASVVLLSKSIGNFTALGCVSVCVGLVCWRSWKALQPQLLPLLAGFALGIPVFGCAYATYSSSRLNLDLQRGLMASGPAIAFLAFFSLGTWLIGSLFRGDLLRDMRRLTRARTVPLGWRAVLLLSISTGIATTLVMAASVAWPRYDIEPWAIVSVLLSTAIAGLCGWHTASLYLRKLFASIAISFSMALVLLTSIYLVLPEGEMLTRSEARTFISVEEPGTWIMTRTAAIEKVVADERAGLADGPPYKVHVSSLAPEGPTITATSASEAEGLLEKYRQKRLAEIKRAAPIMERSYGSWVGLVQTPFHINALHVLPLLPVPSGTVWLIGFGAYATGAMMRTLFMRRTKRRGLA